MEDKLTHLDEKGAARMVDVGAKEITRRTAKAGGFVAMSPDTVEVLRRGNAKKGDVLSTARIAGIMAAKKTGEIIPLCHPLPIDGATVDFDITAEGVAITAEVTCSYKTGVEMEALTAVSAAALTVYDMLKAYDKAMVIGAVRLMEKTGGKSGDYKREE